ncbi:MAG: NADP-dependent oxidoreductase [Candidatus Eremiobacteraeota bacterium]|nr:NADP-dependent oxidoreductase [Candidatus Eremiobacteraeota bacterium]
MIAVRVHQYGGPSELALEHVPMPQPSTGEALIRVHAAGVGPWDALVRSGRSGVPQSLPLVPGSDIAGVVERVETGSQTAIEIGDAIYGVTNPSFTGGYAQYAVASLRTITQKPATLSFVEAASVPVVAVTAWQMLYDHAKVSANQTVLVQGAAGNVGGYAVQLACWSGAHVIAIADSDDESYLRALGAAEVIDSSHDRFEEHVSSVDVVIDTVGGESQPRSFGAMKRGGILVSSVSEPSQELAERYGVRTAYFIVAVTAEQLDTLGNLIDRGILKTDLGVILPLDAARTAHEMLAGTVRHPRGKIVLDVTMLKGP